MFERIVCLTEETTEALYLMEEDWRIVGITGFTVRPPRARKEKPKVSSFVDARFDGIVALKPDLVLTFSDIQADVSAELIRRGIEVHAFNQRSVAGILRMIRTLGALIGRPEKSDRLARELEANLQSGDPDAEAGRLPTIYFEEWNDPMISGIRWVSELIEIAGGRDCFPELSREPLARNRIVSDPAAVIQRSPDIIIGSWCGRKFRPEKVVARDGWDRIPAVRDGHVYEIKSPLILQPGPAALTDGLRELRTIVARWRA